MSRKTYAYGVSLIALIAVLYGLPKTLIAVSDYLNPLTVPQAASELDASSFEKFRLDLQTKLPRDAFRQIEWDYLNKDGGWQIYVAARNARTEQIRGRARTTLIAYGSLVAIASALLVVHLRIASRANSAKS